MAIIQPGGSGGGGSVTAAEIEATFTGAGLVYQGTGVGTGAQVFPPGYEFDYVEITGNVTNATSTPVTAITGNAVTYDGATRIKLEVSASILYVLGGTGTTASLHLYEGSTDLGILVQLYDALGSAELDVPAQRGVFFTPTAATHTYLIKLGRDAGSGTAGLVAGHGGAGAPFAAWYRITKA